MGATLLDGEWDAAALRQRTGDFDLLARDALLDRRLGEARAFGAASDRLSSTTPEFSARSGLTIMQRLVGWLVFISFAIWLSFDTGAALLTFIVSATGVFALITALRCAAAIAAFVRRPDAPEDRLPDAMLSDITVLVPLHREANVVPELVAALCALDYPGLMHQRVKSDTLNLRAFITIPREWPRYAQ